MAHLMYSSSPYSRKQKKKKKKIPIVPSPRLPTKQREIGVEKMNEQKNVFRATVTDCQPHGTMAPVMTCSCRCVRADLYIFIFTVIFKITY